MPAKKKAAAKKTSKAGNQKQVQPDEAPPLATEVTEPKQVEKIAVTAAAPAPPAPAPSAPSQAPLKNIPVSSNVPPAQPTENANPGTKESKEGVSLLPLKRPAEESTESLEKRSLQLKSELNYEERCKLRGERFRLDGSATVTT